MFVLLLLEWLLTSGTLRRASVRGSESEEELETSKVEIKV